MNAFVFDVFTTFLQHVDEDGIYTISCDLVEVGPFNIPDFNNFRRINDKFIQTLLGNQDFIN
jgi:hypothetical protein